MADSFKVMVVDLSGNQSSLEYFDTRDRWLGGSGLAAGLFRHFGLLREGPFHPDQPLIFAIGPLTGYFPLMSKTVLGFMSPYTGQYTESHAGGRSALALKLAGYDALVIKGRAEKPVCLGLGSQQIHIQDAHFLRGMDIYSTGRHLRSLKPRDPGHRSILRIGPAGENLVSYACINVDTYRHFGRMGGGAAMGAKNLKGIILSGDGHLDLDPGMTKQYNRVYDEIYSTVLQSGAMRKYHDLGTAENLIPLNELKALPWRNMQSTHDPDVEAVSGERFARDHLLRQVACAGCPVGCIHIGLLRERFGEEHEFLYRQVSYDYEPIFAMGTMLGITSIPDVLTLLEDVDGLGLDVISAGGALAWATEALDKGIVTRKEALVRLEFGNLRAYREGLEHIAHKSNPFYRALARGTLVAAKEYGGEDFACVLGQEMAGYATGENYFVGQALGFRHSHLDTGAYGYDQQDNARDVRGAIDFMQEQESYRVLMSSMCGCLFGRKAYPRQNILRALNALGYDYDQESLRETVENIKCLRWALKFETGFQPEEVGIPSRFLETETWKGGIDADYLHRLRSEYQEVLKRMAASCRVKAGE
jgi:aldehyde:ferredoxin oxidoreductase